MSHLPSLVLLLGTLVLAGLAGCHNPQRAVSDASFRNATANGAQAELRGLGYRTAGRLNCRTPAGNTLAVVHVHCDGRTTGRLPVQVEGVAFDAETSHPRQEFVIRVGGQEVLRKSCLGQGCNDRSP